ncbi:MAG: BON domain-containing protein [Ignavibacteriae bacterium]|nr:BON domain-containing protein [Ignavibacteriota bacterium]
MIFDEEKSLEIIKQILLNENNKKLEDLEKEFSDYKFLLNDKEYQITTLYPILTDLIDRKIIDSKSDLVRSLSPIMGQAIKQQVVESREDVIDALYPIIGFTIQKSIAEKIKEIYQALNDKIEASLQKGILSKIVKSKISGVSTTDLILQDVFPFEMKEIFLIHESTGILISHVSSLKFQKTVDADLISGMLTAIKNFVSESFKINSENQNLYEIQYGDSKIILERGRYSYLALVISGQEPTSLNNKLSDLNIEIHKKFHKQLREFDGNIYPFSKVENPLIEFINIYESEKSSQEKPKQKPLVLYAFGILFGFILLIIAIFTLPKYFREKTISDKVEEKFTLLNKAEIENIKWEVENRDLNLNGVIPSFSVKNKIDSLISTISEIEKINNNLGIILPIVDEKIISENVKNILSKSEISENQKITFEIDNDEVTLLGNISTIEEKLKLGFDISQINGIRVLINNLEVLENSNLSEADAIKILNETVINFDVNKTSLTKTHIEILEKIIPFLQKNNHLKIEIIGILDKTGNKNVNLQKSNERIESVINYFNTQGISKNIFIKKNSESDKYVRSVEFKVKN